MFALDVVAGTTIAVFTSGAGTLPRGFVASVPQFAGAALVIVVLVALALYLAFYLVMVMLVRSWSRRPGWSEAHASEGAVLPFPLVPFPLATTPLQAHARGTMRRLTITAKTSVDG